MHLMIIVFVVDAVTEILSPIAESDVLLTYETTAPTSVQVHHALALLGAS